MEAERKKAVLPRRHGVHVVTGVLEDIAAKTVERFCKIFSLLVSNGKPPSTATGSMVVGGAPLVTTEGGPKDPGAKEGGDDADAEPGDR
jgi:hypothetical protein